MRAALRQNAAKAREKKIKRQAKWAAKAEADAGGREVEYVDDEYADELEEPRAKRVRQPYDTGDNYRPVQRRPPQPPPGAAAGGFTLAGRRADYECHRCKSADRFVGTYPVVEADDGIASTIEVLARNGSCLDQCVPVHAMALTLQSARVARQTVCPRCRTRELIVAQLREAPQNASVVQGICKRGADPNAGPVALRERP